ncbi:type IV pilus assembly protein PilW [Luteibacter sp. PvP120]
MVGIVISIICTLGIMSAFAAFESQKRTTTAGSDAQQSGSFAAVALEREIRTAGSALVQGKNYGVWGCAITAYSQSTKRLPRASALAAPFANWPLVTRATPVLVASGGAISPDVIGIVRGNPSLRVFKTNVTSTSGANVVVDNAFGFAAGEYVLISDKSGSCTLGKTQSVTIGSGTGTILLTAGDAPSGSFDGTYTGAAYLMDWGLDPAVSLFGVDTTTNSLLSYDLLQKSATSATAVPGIAVADSVVNMKTLYGVDDGAGTGHLAGDGIIDEWVQPIGATWGIAALSPATDTPAAVLARAQILAVRVAIVVQSRQMERAAPATAASVQGAGYIGYTGPTTLTLFPDQATANQYTITTSSSYRYKVYDMVIPIRNNYIKQYF